MLKNKNMWIEIKDDIFNANDREKLTYLLKIIFEKPNGSQNHRANLILNIDKILDSNLFQSLSSTDQGLIEDSVKLYAYENNTTINHVISNIQDNTFTIEESIVYLKEPLWIVLENSMNDSNFIKAIIYHYDDAKGYVKDCIDNRWIDFANAGGSGAKNQIKGKLSTYDKLVAINQTVSEKYYRGFVLLDGDTDYPAQNINSKYLNLTSFLDSKKIKWHILEKRAMENYMPDEVINDIKNIKSTSTRTLDLQFIEWTNVYQFLTEDQKNHLRYESSKNFEDLDNQTQDLYKNQKGKNFSILSRGISYRDFETPNIEEDERRFKNSFPKLFLMSPYVNKSSLKARCGNDELETIFNKIKSML